MVKENTPAGGVVTSERIGKRLTTENLGGEIILKRVVVVEAASGHIGASLAH